VVASTGRRLGRYHLVEPIGFGPCGEVFRAKVVGVAGMERQFAIKRFYPPLIARPDVGPRLQQSIRSYGGLDHPRIARLAEFGVASGETFTATELVPGLDLGRLVALSGERLPAGAALALVSAAARAIGFAHGRGVCHLGVAPGNLIATPDGDAKVTDFGILHCRLGGRITDEEGLVGRVPYLAPEQLLGEVPAAAADVFSLGVVAYELVGGGRRPFVGATAAEVAQAIVSARPAPLDLPRPIARVIDRCLARSPFERFPDARSLADALDAALRLAPLPGDRREVAGRVTAAVEHLARINEQQLSGALNFAAPLPADRGQRSAAAPLPLPPPASGPPRSTTVMAVPPPPSVTTLSASPPPVPPPTPPPTPPPRAARRTAPPPLFAPPTEPGLDPTRPRGPTDELSIGDETAPRIEPLWPPTEPVQLLTGPRARLGATAPPPPVLPLARPGATAPPVAAPPPGSVAAAPPGSVAAPPVATRFDPPALAPPRRRGWLYALALILVAGGVAGAVIALRGDGVDAPSAPVDGGRGDGSAAPTAVAPRPIDAAVAPVAPIDGASAIAIDGGAAPDDGAPTAVDGGAVDGGAVDAGAVDGGAADAGAPPAGGALELVSNPAGARAFLDGADLGVTPLTLPPSSDRHDLALYLPGHALHLASIDGAGRHDVALTPVPSFTGLGGIKVRCKAKRRYYVFIDGAPTGELCPTERIPVSMGEHQVEIYDLITETRQSGKVRVVQTARSTRIKFD
jgi:serine/threonine protein kinase